MNIYQKLIEVRKVVPYLKKENSGFQYNYVSSSQVLGAIKEKMNEVGLVLIPEVIGHKVTVDTYDKVDNKGNAKRTVDYFTELDVLFTWVNADNPEEKIPCRFYAQGVDTAGEKGTGKAMTYAEKYFMLKSFNVPTDKDDPDAFQQKHEDGSKAPVNVSKSNKNVSATKDIKTSKESREDGKEFDLDVCKRCAKPEEKQILEYKGLGLCKACLTEKAKKQKEDKANV